MPFRVYVALDDGGSISRLLPKRASMRQDIGECTFALLLEPPVLPSLGHLKAIPPCSAMFLHPTRISRKAFGAWCLMVSWCSLVVPPGGLLVVFWCLLVISWWPVGGLLVSSTWLQCLSWVALVFSGWSPGGLLVVSSWLSSGGLSWSAGRCWWSAPKAAGAQTLQTFRVQMHAECSCSALIQTGVFEYISSTWTASCRLLSPEASKLVFTNAPGDRCRAQNVSKKRRKCWKNTDGNELRLVFSRHSEQT